MLAINRIILSFSTQLVEDLYSVYSLKGSIQALVEFMDPDVTKTLDWGTLRNVAITAIN